MQVHLALSRLNVSDLDWDKLVSKVARTVKTTVCRYEPKSSECSRLSKIKRKGLTARQKYEKMNEEIERFVELYKWRMSKKRKAKRGLYGRRIEDIL